MTVATRHRETGVSLRAPSGRQNKLAIHLGLIRDTNAITNYRSGRISVWCESVTGVRAVRNVACAYGMTDIELTGDMIRRDGTVATRLNIPCEVDR